MKGLWNATCGESVSTTNGLLAQLKDHRPKECGICNKNWVELGYDGNPTEHCKVCAAFQPVQRTKMNARPDSHAYRNPELHTGLDGNGKSWVGTQCISCDLSRTDNEGGICDTCRRPKAVGVSGGGFNMEEA